MNVLHLIGGELTGGAAKGTYLLHQGLNKVGINSKILTNSKETFNDPTVESIALTKKQKACNIIRSELDNIPLYLYRSRGKYIYSNALFGYDFTKHPLYRWAEIINLHWINSGFIRIKDISKIKKPLVWTLRDMWPMTGGCHTAMDCNNYLYGCGSCIQLGSKNKYDLSRWNVKRKQKHLPKGLILVGIGTWLSECAKNSYLFYNNRVETFYNNISQQEFFPVKKDIAKDMLKLPDNQKIILAGSINASDFHKGFDKYIEVLRHLDHKASYLLLFFGKFEKAIVDNLGFDYISLGYLYDTISLRLAYSAANVFVAPSTMESFGKTLAEAMACGTPVVAFNATGPKDIVDHKINGYLAEPYEPESLAKGIEWVINHPEPELLSNNARQKVLDCFEMEKVAKRYKALYEEILYNKAYH